jgi:hypothetical protein
MVGFAIGVGIRPRRQGLWRGRDAVLYCTYIPYYVNTSKKKGISFAFFGALGMLRMPLLLITLAYHWQSLRILPYSGGRNFKRKASRFFRHTTFTGHNLDTPRHRYFGLLPGREGRGHKCVEKFFLTIHPRSTHFPVLHVNMCRNNTEICMPASQFIELIVSFDEIFFTLCVHS